MDTARRRLEIVNQRGLHARASAKFVNAVSVMEGVEVLVAKDGMKAAGGSILGLMMLGAAKGDTIEIAVSGEEAEARLDELSELVTSGFGED
ncbi:HPr family phosphocarrier protein [Altericroceibacterium xinjiangense]|uniref:HPr family phosphocarrier protein n=1 Tax=Altericroceibacterium xinjiangense TaxID=762261 RepID=UPI000F7D5D93|nr:HPr family phosphocarrier protein [Altericroceibacterium xinjiangense]